MTKVIKFQEHTPFKYGHRRVKRKKKVDLEEHGQLNLFSSAPSGARIIKMPSQLSPFEEALVMDETGDRMARDFYLKAVKAGDCIADAYCNLGIIESQEGNLIKAIDYLTLCLKDDPRHFEAHYNLANVYSEAGNLKLARLHYQISIELQPDFSNSYYNLGLILAINNEVNEAINILTQYKQLATFEEKHNADELLVSLKKSLK